MKCFRLLACLMMITWLLSGSKAEGAGFIWPSELTEIGEEAFEGSLMITEIDLPDSVRAIGSGAFAGCTMLNRASIPAGVTEIGEDAFDQCGEALLIECRPGSTAMEYAIGHQLDYRAGTTCRALIIGQTYTGTSLALQGPANDLNAVRFCLNNLGWTVHAVTNLSPDRILSAISTTFSEAADYDISLFYYSGHGNEDGSLVGSDGKSTLLPTRLRAALDTIPGRKVIVVDACYSGQLIADDAETTVEAKGLLAGGNQTEQGTDYAVQFVSAFQSAFSRMWLRGALNSGSYFVITSAREQETSGEGYITSGKTSRIMGFFTNAFCLGLGYNGVTMQSTSLSADQNGDNAVSIEEAFQWASNRALQDSESQHAAVWPAGCRWFAPFRP